MSDDLFPIKCKKILIFKAYFQTVWTNLFHLSHSYALFSKNCFIFVYITIPNCTILFVRIHPNLLTCIKEIFKRYNRSCQKDLGVSKHNILLSTKIYVEIYGGILPHPTCRQAT